MTKDLFFEVYERLPYFTHKESNGFAIAPIQFDDHEPIRLWRNSQIDILRQDEPLSEQEQKDYFQDIIKPLFHDPSPPQILVRFLQNYELIGYGGLINIDWIERSAEISFLVKPDRKSYTEDMTAFFNLICQLAFEDLKLRRIYTETYLFRKEHIAQIEKLGFSRKEILPKRAFKRGRWVDSVIHELVY